MKDPAFTRLFGYPEVAELLIRDVLPEHADRIDLATLEKLGTELVGEALARRYADLMWTARTRDGTAQVLILIEFQGRHGAQGPRRGPRRAAAQHGQQEVRGGGQPAASHLLGTPPDSGRLPRAAAAILDCSTEEELIRRVAGAASEDS